MKEKLVITVLGSDKTGIVANVSSKLTEMSLNIIDINQSIFEDSIFAMIMLVDFSDSKQSIAEIKERFDALEKELSVKIYVQHSNIFTTMHRI